MNPCIFFCICLCCINKGALQVWTICICIFICICLCCIKKGALQDWTIARSWLTHPYCPYICQAGIPPTSHLGIVMVKILIRSCWQYSPDTSHLVRNGKAGDKAHNPLDDGYLGCGVTALFLFICEASIHPFLVFLTLLKVEKTALKFLRILKAAILEFSKVLTSLVKQWLGGLMRYCCENCSHWKSHNILWWHFIIITIIIIFKILSKQPLMEKSHQSLLFSLLCSSLAALNNKQWPQERWTRTKMLMLMTPKIWRKTPQDIKNCGKQRNRQGPSYYI